MTAQVEVLTDEKQTSTVGYLLLAVAWFDGQGISCTPVTAAPSAQNHGEKLKRTGHDLDTHQTMGSPEFMERTQGFTGESA